LPPQEGQEIEDQLTQEQFDEELQNDVDVMLTQEDVHEDEAREAVEGEEEEGEDESSSSGGYVSPGILTQQNPDGGQQRTSWTLILT